MEVAFSDNKHYLLLLRVCFGAMTTRFFLPTNQRLISELPMYTYITIFIFIYATALEATAPTVFTLWTWT